MELNDAAIDPAQRVFGIQLACVIRWLCVIQLADAAQLLQSFVTPLASVTQLLQSEARGLRIHAEGHPFAEN